MRAVSQWSGLRSITQRSRMFQVSIFQGPVPTGRSMNWSQDRPAASHAARCTMPRKVRPKGSVLSG